jgi:hypothetical protein
LCLSRRCLTASDTAIRCRCRDGIVPGRKKSPGLSPRAARIESNVHPWLAWHLRISEPFRPTLIDRLAIWSSCDGHRASHASAPYVRRPNSASRVNTAA